MSKSFAYAIFAVFCVSLQVMPQSWAQPTLVAIIPVRSQPQHIAVNSRTHKIYITHFTDRTVEVIDGLTNSVIKVLFFQESVQNLAINESTNRIYVSTGTHKVTVIDGNSDSVIATATHFSTWPEGVGVDPIGNLVYVAGEASTNGLMYVLNGLTNINTGPVTVGAIPNPVPMEAAVDPQSNRIYVNLFEEQSCVAVDGSSHTVLGRAPVNAKPRGLAVNPWTHRLYVTSEYHGLTVFHSYSMSALATLNFYDPNNRARLLGDVAVNPRTNQIYVVADNSRIMIVDGATFEERTFIHSFPKGSARTMGVAVDTQTNRIYFTDYESNVVSVYQDNVQDDVTPSPTGFIVTAAPRTISEGVGSGAVFGSIRLNGVAREPLTIGLTCDSPGAANVPASITIPAGESGASFPIDVVDDSLADGNQNARIVATASNLPTASTDITVTNDDSPSLNLVIPYASIGEGSGGVTVPGSVTVTPTGSDMVVMLSSSDSSTAIVPSSLTIPALQTGGSFPITIVKNSKATGSRSVSITASQNGISKTVTLVVTDEESALLTLSPVTVAEGKSALATVTRNTSTATPLAVNVSVGDSSIASITMPVTIPVGLESVQFSISGIRDFLDNPNNVRSTSLYAAAVNHPAAEATLRVTDIDVPRIELKVAPGPTLQEGAPAQVLVRRNKEPLSEPLHVALTSNNPSVLSDKDQTGGALFQTVTIPAGATSVVVPLDVRDDTVFRGNQSVRLTIAAAGYSNQSTSLTVIDNDGGRNFFMGLGITHTFVSEGAGKGAAMGRVTISRTLPVNLLLTLSSSRPDKVLVQAINGIPAANITLTIPANSLSASFFLNAVPNAVVESPQNVSISIKASTVALSPVSRGITVIDDDGVTNTFSLSFTSNVVREGGVLTAILRRHTSQSGLSVRLPVTITTAPDGQFRTLPPLTFAAGSSTLMLPLTTTQNTTSEVSQGVTVRITAPGYTPVTETVTIIDDNDNIGAGEDLLSIQGRVTSASGRGIATLVVKARGPVVAQTVTDELGNYALPHIPRGQYTLSPQSTHYTFTPSSRSITLGSRSITDQTFVTTARTFNVAGYVVDTNSRAISGVTFTLRKPDGSVVIPAPSPVFGAGGTFTLRNLAAGHYTLSLSKAGYRFAPAEWVVKGVTGPVALPVFYGESTTAPLIEAFLPARGAVGDVITLEGSNLKGTSKVIFGTTSSTPIAGTVTSTQLQVRVPLGAIDGGKLTVQSPNGSYQSQASFDVLQRPIIASLSVSKAKWGDIVTINGANFGPDLQVRFGDALVKGFLAINNVQLRLEVPDEAPIGPTQITVMTSDGIARRNFFVKHCWSVTASGNKSMRCNDGTNEVAPRGINDIEDTLQEPGCLSSIRLSSASVLAQAGIVRLQWTAPLSREVAQDVKHYRVVVDGQEIPIENATLDASNTVVTLSVEAGAIHRGALVGISWRDLRDGKGCLLPYQGSTFKAH